ncbi:MAG: nucleotidyltransferase domain-containing protein [bacterium]
MKEKALEVIKEILSKKGLKIVKIILFGSRARGDFKWESDWDFLVVIDKELTFTEKHQIIDEIQIQLAKLKIPNDIIIKSEKQFSIMKEYPGNISFYAYQEGQEI